MFEKAGNCPQCGAPIYAGTPRADAAPPIDFTCECRFGLSTAALAVDLPEETASTTDADQAALEALRDGDKPSEASAE